MPLLFLDIETKSTVDLKVFGPHRYAADPTTEVWCAAFAVDHSEVRIWTPGELVPTEFSDPNYEIAAFNAAFERLIVRYVLGPRYGWPAIPLQRYRCLQASALAHALPASLEGAAAALALGWQKDTAGRKVMLDMAKPRKPRKGEDPSGVYWHDDAERRQILHDYCKRDVETERELWRKVGFLTEPEQELWLLDQTINDRGIHIDRALAEAAIKISNSAKAAIDAELCELTRGAVEHVTERDRLQEWLLNNGCKVDGMDKTTLRHALRRKGLDAKASRAIELRIAGAHAAASKPAAMLNRMSVDNRARGQLRFHGTRTGRWSAIGIQVQNFKRQGDEDVDAAMAAISTGDIEKVRPRFPSPMETVGSIVRAMITAGPGHRFIIADLSGIESRLTAWVSGQANKLAQWKQFDETKDPADEPYAILGKQFGLDRNTAKTCDLAFQYQGGVNAYHVLAPNDDDCTDEQIKSRQKQWRDAHPYTVQMWNALNRAAIRAVQYPGQTIHMPRQAWQRVSFRSDGLFLRMALPSGRMIAYAFPEIIERVTPWGAVNSAVSCKDYDDGKWVDYAHGHGLYGGVWLDHLIQGTARDIFASAMQRLEAANYLVVLTVHDEVVAEVPDGFGSMEEFQRILITPPDWAADLPLGAKVRNGPRFAKTAKPEVVQIETADAKPEASLDDPLEDLLTEAAAKAEADTAQAPPASISTVTGAEASSDIDTRPCWSSPILVEEMSLGPEFEAILASLSAEDRAIARPPAAGNGRDRGADKPRNGRDRQTEGKIHCPFHRDGTASLQIYNEGDDPHYHCFGCGAHGPLTDLPQDLIAAASSSTPHQQTDNAVSLAYAHRLWEQAQPIAGTLAARYLAEVRGVDVNALAPNIETVLRFHPTCPFNGNRHPCLLALFRDVETNEPAGIHRIALRLDAQKMERRMLGRWVRPRAIKLWPLIRSEVPLYLGEGVETVLAAATRLRDRDRPMRPAWAAGSSGNVEKFPIVPGVEELTLLVDRDPSGEAAAAACYRNWKTAGRRVRRLRTHDPSLNDFNDLICAKLQVAS
jgi:DNA polymerase